MRRRLGRSGTDDAAPTFSDVRVKGSMDADRDDHEAIITEYTKQLKRESANKAEESIWNVRCSISVLGALLIWLLIGLFVLHMINDGQRKAIARDGMLTGEMMLKGDFTGRNPASGNAAGAAAESIKVQLPPGCLGSHCRQEGGTEEFGSILGTNAGVFAFGNCFHSTCISLIANWIDVPITRAAAEQLQGMAAAADTESSVSEQNGRFTRSLPTGMKWQCVEYARRYWMLAGTPEPAYFEDVDGAADIWELDQVRLLDDTTMPLLKYANGVRSGAGGDAPRVGDLVLYDRNEDMIPYGHVAVVVGVELPDPDLSETESGVVFLAEQNWHNVAWPGPYHNYSRSVPLRLRVDGAGRRTYTLLDPFLPIKGWVRYGQS